MPFVPLRDGHSLRIRVVGSESGSPVVMLAGLGMTSAEWLPFVAPYLRRFRFYMPDYRGFGGSRHVPVRGADLFDNHTADVLDVVDHFGLRDFALVGYSLGASTSLHLQRAHGFDRVSRYLHVDQSPFVGRSADWSYGLLGDKQPQLASALRNALAVVEAQGDATSVAELGREARRELAHAIGAISPLLGLGSRAAPVLDAVFSLPTPITRRIPLSDLAHLRVVLGAYSRAEHDYRASLRGCSTPITVFVGMRSGLYDPRGQMAIADYAPNTTIVRFHESGHLPPFQEPRKFVRELGRFLDGPS